MGWLSEFLSILTMYSNILFGDLKESRLYHEFIQGRSDCTTIVKEEKNVIIFSADGHEGCPTRKNVAESMYYCYIKSWLGRSRCLVTPTLSQSHIVGKNIVAGGMECMQVSTWASVQGSYRAGVSRIGQENMKVND